MITELIKQKAEQYTPELIAFRRDLHQHPELSMQEHRTAQKIAEQLSKLEGMQVIPQVAGGTGVIGILHGKKEREKRSCCELTLTRCRLRKTQDWHVLRRRQA